MSRLFQIPRPIHRWFGLITAMLIFIVLSGVHVSAMSPDLKELFSIPSDMEPQFQLIATSPAANYSEDQLRVNAPDIVSLEAAHIGGQRLLFRVTFDHPIQFDDGSLLHFYLDMDNNLNTGRQDRHSYRGVDIMVTLSDNSVSPVIHNTHYRRGDVFAGGITDGHVLYLVLEAPLHGDDQEVELGVFLLAERWLGGRSIGRSDSTPRRVVQLHRQQEVDQLQSLDRTRLSSLAPLSEYRFVNDFVKYETLENKGLTYDVVAPLELLSFGRERPLVPFMMEVRHREKVGEVARRQEPIYIAEEAGVARRDAPVSFGFPLPQGAVYDLNHFRVLSPADEEIPAQLTATAFWPDDSLKWVLIDFTAELAPREERVYTVEFGYEVRSLIANRDGVILEENDETIVVTTGPLRVQMNKNAFNLFERVWIDIDGDGIFSEDEKVAASGDEGIGMVDEHGTLYTTSARAPESIRIEQFGPEKAVIRVEGQYASDEGDPYMRYVIRLIFRAGSTRVHVIHTHVNDYLETEFTDITSLYVPIETTQPISQASVFTDEPVTGLTAHCECGSEIRMFQMDEKTAEINGKTVRRPFWTPGSFPGVIRVLASDSAVTAVIHDFQERWPKGLAVDGNRLFLELLPEQPDANYGAALPYYLMYPFVSGKYRSKWGNSFTERMTIDFGGTVSVDEMAADGHLPVVAVIPREWYHETGVFGPIPVSADDYMAAWDDFVSDSYSDHIERKVVGREFGYFNYGDWFGERGRNWGNNEYDLAHGFFMEFVRSGDRRYYRLALAAARHQADVDIIHAYPNPAFVGANAPHSVAHTGSWSQNLPQGTWSKAYDASFTGSNGHTWADGMMAAWYLAGDARVMEAALSLGEHIVWFTVPQFNALGSHERSGGWALKALMALYRGTYDPVYLEAAQKIVSVVLREQDLTESGAWPHVLPTGHSGGRQGVVGNALFLIGILLGGLQSYHMETNDPSVMTSLEAGVEWLVMSWDPQERGWPYTATVEGEPLYSVYPDLNALVAPAVAYVGSLNKDYQLLQITKEAMKGLIEGGPKGDGKSIAMALHFASDVLGRLMDTNTGESQQE